MKKFLYSVAFASAVLLLHGCQKETSDAGLESAGLYKAKGSTTATSTTMRCDNIGFDNVRAGTLVTSLYSDGGLGPIAVTSHNSRYPGEPEAAMIFDSGNPHMEDVDLGTPNFAYGGPGQGWGGTPPQPTRNDEAMGNILIIQNFDYAAPNDDDVASQITMDFSSIGKITAKQITVIDAETLSRLEYGGEEESGTIKLYSHQGGTLLYTATVPNTNQNGVLDIDLGNTSGVGYIVFDLNGSMGFNDLSFCVEQRQSRCTYTQGYWKNHEEAWPVDGLTIGGIFYSKATLLNFFRTPVKGNGLVSMGHQLVAAMLNVANGADGSAINATIAAANNLIQSNGLNLTTGYLHPSRTSSLNDQLTRYNEGQIGPGHCN